MAVYREFAPRPELRPYVRAFAWYGPVQESDPWRPPVREHHIGDECALTPSFADAHTSILFPLGVSWCGNAWRESSIGDATMMGALTRATQPPGEASSAMIGVYLRPLGCSALIRSPAAALTDRVVPLRDLWRGAQLSPERVTLPDVEAFVMRRLSIASPSPRARDIAALASHVHRHAGRVSVAHMAHLTGLSRQHLTRLFQQHVGVGPKLYARLARFRAALGHVGKLSGAGNWSGLAASLGYADQSHLIAEFREFASFTPDRLAHGDHFHPFIGDEAPPSSSPAPRGRS